VAGVAAREFFDSLESRVGQKDLSGIRHTYRFEIDGAGTWTVAIDGGRVTVSEGATGGAPDATVRTSSDVFDRLVAGKQNPATAFMTGKVKVEGDLGAVMKLQKVF